MLGAELHARRSHASRLARGWQAVRPNGPSERAELLELSARPEASLPQLHALARAHHERFGTASAPQPPPPPLAQPPDVAAMLGPRRAAAAAAAPRADYGKWAPSGAGEAAVLAAAVAEAERGVERMRLENGRLLAEACLPFSDPERFLLLGGPLRGGIEGQL